jgi:hypothetical protein
VCDKIPNKQEQEQEEREDEEEERRKEDRLGCNIRSVEHVL